MSTVHHHSKITVFKGIFHNLFRGNQKDFSHSFDSFCENKGRVVVCSQIHQLGKDAGVKATIGRRKLSHFFLGETLRIKMAKQYCNAVKSCAVRK